MSVRGESIDSTKMPTEVEDNDEEHSQSTVSWIFNSIVSGVKNFNDTLTDFVKTIDVVDADTDTDAEDDDASETSSFTKRQGKDEKKQENLVHPQR